PAVWYATAGRARPCPATGRRNRPRRFPRNGRADRASRAGSRWCARRSTQCRGIPCGDRLRNALDEIGAHRPILITQRDRGWSHIFFFQISCLAAIDGTNALGFYARCPKLAIANEFDTKANGSRTLYPPTRAIAARMEGLSRHSPGRDLRRSAAGPSL